MSIVSQGYGSMGGTGGSPVTQVISSVDIVLGPAELNVALEGQIVVELLTPQIVLCED